MGADQQEPLDIGSMTPEQIRDKKRELWPAPAAPQQPPAEFSKKTPEEIREEIRKDRSRLP